MFSLGLPHLLAIGVPSSVAAAYVGPLAAAFARFEIDQSGTRAACFLGQCQVESRNFTVFQEDLFYTHAERVLEVFHGNGVRDLAHAATLVRNPEKLANVVYANKGGNGDEASGDGWRYAGKGPIQTTTKNNYAAAEKGCGRPYLAQPELLLTAEDGCLAAAFFWHENGLNDLADQVKTSGLKPGVDKITRRVNRAMLDADLRLRRTQRALGVFQTLETI